MAVEFEFQGQLPKVALQALADDIIYVIHHYNKLLVRITIKLLTPLMLRVLIFILE